MRKGKVGEWGTSKSLRLTKELSKEDGIDVDLEEDANIRVMEVDGVKSIVITKVGETKW